MIQHFAVWIFVSFFFLSFFKKPFHLCVFSALYCCVGEAQGREGGVGLTMHCGTESSCGCTGKGGDGGDYFEWMFFRQGKEENPRWRWVV